MTHRHLAWFAGILDGEGYIGCFYADKAKKRPRVAISISITHRYIPLAFRARFGGSAIRLRKYPRNRKTVYRWWIVDKAAQEALRELLPFLTIKRRRAIQAITWQPWRPRGWNQYSQPFVVPELPYQSTRRR